MVRSSQRSLVALGMTGLLCLAASSALADEPFKPGTLIENVAARLDPSQTYTLYLPSSYAPPKKSPLLLVFAA